MATRKVTKAPEGQAGYVVEGFPNNTYDETTAKRLQYMRMDGSNEFDFPESGVLAEVDPTKVSAAIEAAKKRAQAAIDEHHALVDANRDLLDSRRAPALTNPSGRPE